MNCQDISLILDTRDVRRLTATEGEAVEAHLHGCPDCANDWQAHRRALGSRVPEMASDLPGRVWSFLEAPVSSRKAGAHVRRPLVLGGLLFVGAAAAMIGWLSLREPVPESLSMAIPAVIESGAGVTATKTQRDLLPAQPDVPATENQDSDPPAVAGSVLRYTLIVLPPRHENLDPAAIAYFNAAYHAILGELRSKPDLEIVEATAWAVEMAEADVPPSSPPPSLTPPLPPGLAELGIVLPPPSANSGHDIGRDHAIAHHLGGEYTLRMSLTVSSSGYWSIDTRYRGSPRDGGYSRNGTHGFGINPMRQGEDPRSVGAMIARQVYAGLFPDSALSQYLPVLRDARETESKRLDVLSEALGSIRSGSDGLTDAVLQGALELARSDVPETRRRVWQLLRPDNPTAVEALGNAMLSDPEVEVQREAFNSLFKAASGNPFVRATFESAAVSDPSAVVRVLAKMALMPNGERPAFVISTLHDRSLAAEARTAPLMIARRNPSIGVSLDDRALSALVEIAEGSSDPAIKAAARAEIARASRAR